MAPGCQRHLALQGPGCCILWGHWKEVSLTIEICFGPHPRWSILSQTFYDVCVVLGSFFYPNKENVSLPEARLALAALFDAYLLCLVNRTNSHPAQRTGSGLNSILMGSFITDTLRYKSGNLNQFSSRFKIFRHKVKPARDTCFWSKIKMAAILNPIMLCGQQGPALCPGLSLWSLKLSSTAWLGVYAVSPHVLSSSLETSALTCLGGSFYRFVVSHLNPVAKDINLHSVCQLQQKIIETGMSLRLTLIRSYPGNVGVNARASVV